MRSTFPGTLLRSAFCGTFLRSAACGFRFCVFLRLVFREQKASFSEETGFFQKLDFA